MDEPSGACAKRAICNVSIDMARRIFEQVIALDATRRDQWLLENVADEAVRKVVARLVVADGKPGVLDFSVLRLLDAISGADG